MALIKCIECGRDVSSRAISCPNCGCPIANTEIQRIDSSVEEQNALKWEVLRAYFYSVSEYIKLMQYTKNKAVQYDKIILQKRNNYVEQLLYSDS